MSFQLKPGQPVRRELKRMVRDQLQRAQGHLHDGAESHVHQARKCLKKARAVVELLKRADTSGAGKDRHRLQAAGRILSALRDADAVISTLDRVGREFPERLSEHTLARVRREFARARKRRIADARKHRCVAHVADTLRGVRRSTAKWAIPKVALLDLPQLVKASYRAARKAMRLARRTAHASDLHLWRTRVKTVWYQLRLLQASAAALRPLIGDLKKLETFLGEHHDLSVLRSGIAKEPSLRRAVGGELTQLTELSTTMQGRLSRQALDIGRRLLAAKPKEFSRAVRDALSASTPRAMAARSAPAPLAAGRRA